MITRVPQFLHGLDTSINTQRGARHLLCGDTLGNVTFEALHLETTCTNAQLGKIIKVWKCSWHFQLGEGASRQLLWISQSILRNPNDNSTLHNGSDVAFLSSPAWPWAARDRRQLLEMFEAHSSLKPSTVIRLSWTKHARQTIWGWSSATFWYKLHELDR